MAATSSTERIRRLNNRGVAGFRSYLEHVREGGLGAAPRDLLTDPKATSSLERDVWVEDQPFPDRMAAARYLSRALGDPPALDEDVGLWSWLSLFYFEQVSPPKGDGKRAPGRDYRHILEPGFPYGFRHLLAGAVLVYRLYGENAPLLLRTRVDRESKFHHELTARQAFISNPVVVEAVHLLYWDDGKNRARPGALQGGEPGGLRRFIDVVQQLDVNYDLYSMEAEKLVELLPEEFRPWKAGRRGLFGKRR